MNEITKLLIKHNYIPVLKKCGDGCLINLPEAMLTGHDEYEEKIEVVRGDESGINFSCSEDNEPRFLEIPEYAIRPFILSNLWHHCYARGINHSVCLYLDEQGYEVNDISECVDEPENLEEEETLLGLVIDGIQNGFDESKAGDLIEGYRLCRYFFEES